MKMSVRLQAEGCPDTTNMETLYQVPFLVLECSNLMLKKPPWVHTPSAVMGYAVMVVSYFLIAGGIIYDVSREPPSVGAMTDEHGLPLPTEYMDSILWKHSHPASCLQWKVQVS